MNGNNFQTSGLTRALAPTEDGSWKEVNSKNSLEEALSQENTRRFTQANNTPLMKGRAFQD